VDERRPEGSSRAWRSRAGLALLLAAWAGNWTLDGLRTHLLFFPLWLGYVLFVDAAIERRDGSSPWTRSPRAFIGLFALSVPLWWLFEAANERLANWEYLGREHFSDREYSLYASLAFSTVVPAVLVSAEWARGLGWIRRLKRGPSVRPSRALACASFLLGLALLATTLCWPRTCYPLLWVSGVFLLEPLVAVRGRGLVRDLARGDWRPWLSLWAGGLLCGFLWELWNFHSYPKWIYHTPGVERPKLFEMPLLGYLGYLPFALEVYLVKELWLREPELLQDRNAPP
jgi:hypothetical protein